MREISKRWSPPPDRSHPVIDRHDLEITWVRGLRQTLLSGDLKAARADHAAETPEVGLCGIANEGRALVRLARDRALLVSELADEPEIEPGWHAAGYAATPMDDAWAVLDLAGPKAASIVAQGAAVDLGRANASPSAALLFAGCWCILYRRASDRARLHVEQPFAAYMASWLNKVARSV